MPACVLLHSGTSSSAVKQVQSDQLETPLRTTLPILSGKCCHICNWLQSIWRVCPYRLSCTCYCIQSQLCIQPQRVMLTHSHRLCGCVHPCICNLQQVSQEDCLACRAMRSIQWRIRIPLMTCMPVTGQQSSSHILYA